MVNGKLPGGGRAKGTGAVNECGETYGPERVRDVYMCMYRNQKYVRLRRNKEVAQHAMHSGSTHLLTLLGSTAPHRS